MFAIHVICSRFSLSQLLIVINKVLSTSFVVFLRINHVFHFLFFLDPYIKVAGLPEERQAAKQMILSVMDSKVSEHFISLIDNKIKAENI